MKRTPRGFVIGLRDGNDDHLTIGLDDNEEFVQLHRTRQRVELWRHTSDSMKEAFKSYLDTNAEAISLPEFKTQQAYFVSFRRLMVVYEGLQLIASFLINIFGRFIVSYRVDESENGSIQLYFIVELERAKHLISGIAKPFLPFFNFLNRFPLERRGQILIPIAKKFLVKIRKDGALETDAALLFSKDKLGFLWVDKKTQTKFVSFDALFKGQQLLEDGLPFGKLKELGKLVKPVGSFEIEA